MRGLVMLLAAGLLAAAMPVAAAPEWQKLLERAVRSPRSAAHVGTLKVLAAGQPGGAVTVRVTCDGRGGERREHLDGPARGTVVLTVGRRSWQRGPADLQWTALPPGPDAAPLWERLVRNYELRGQGEERVAGRRAWKVALVPRHGGNPRQTLWLDAAAPLVLRSESTNYQGRPAASTVYTAVVLKATQSLAAPGTDAVAPSFGPALWEECRSEADLVGRVGFEVPLPARLPPGYAPAAYYARGCMQGGLLPVVRYSDGLNALTLFATHGGRGAGRGMGRGMGGGMGMGRGMGGGMGRGMGGGRGPGMGRGFGRGPGACRLEQMSGQQVAQVVYGPYTYVLVGDHEPGELADTLQSLGREP